jgi:hypothetical protein
MATAFPFVIFVDILDLDNFLLIAYILRQNHKSRVAIVLSLRAVDFSATKYGKDFFLPEGMPKTRRLLPVLAGQDEGGWWYEDEGTENAEIREDTVCYMHVSACRIVQALGSLQIERARYDLF